MDCYLVDIPQSYVKSHPPPVPCYCKTVDLRIQVILHTLDKIDTVSNTITITTEISIRWNDKRLAFLNPLINQPNMVSDAERQKIWLPSGNLILLNAIIGKIDYDPYQIVQVIPKIPEMIDWESSYENRRYNGSYNLLGLSQKIKAKYNCRFDVYKFPFDDQKCSLGFRIPRHKGSNLRIIEEVPAEYIGPDIVDQFKIGPVKGKVESTETYAGYTMEISSKRIFTQQLLKTFIPSFIFWMLGYSTLFIDHDYPEGRLNSAITVMLVFVTLLNVANGDLPETSYMKMIDLWFFWHIVMIFVVILYHIILQRMRKNLIAPRILVARPCSQVNDKNHMQEKDNKDTLRTINRIAISLFPLANGIFYGIYFGVTLI